MPAPTRTTTTDTGRRGPAHAPRPPRATPAGLLFLKRDVRKHGALQDCPRATRPPRLPRAPDAHGRLYPRPPPSGPFLPNATRSARGLPSQQGTILQAIPPEAKLQTMAHQPTPSLLTTNPPRSLCPPPPTRTPQKDPVPTGTLPAQSRTRYAKSTPPPNPSMDPPYPLPSPLWPRPNANPL